MRTVRRLLLLAALAAPWFNAPAQAPSLPGLWKTISHRTGQPDGLVRVREENGELVGRVEKILRPSASGGNPVCERCTGPLKDQPVIGLPILRVRAESEGRYTGEVLEPDTGRSYRCIVTVLDGGSRLEVRGYVGVPALGRSEFWAREG